MREQIECPKCHSYKIKVVDRVYYGSILLIMFVIAAVFGLMYLGDHGDVNSDGTVEFVGAIGGLVFGIFTIVSLMMLIFHGKKRITCKSCGYQIS